MIPRQHQADLDKYPFEYYMVPTLEYWYSFQIIYPVVLFTVKMSILALYHRVFPSERFRMAVGTTIPSKARAQFLTHISQVYVVGGFITAITLTSVFVHVRSVYFIRLIDGESDVDLAH